MKIEPKPIGTLLRDVKILSGKINESMRVLKIASSSVDVTKGCVFVAMKGEHGDGHDHIGEALENGASIVVCEREIDEYKGDDRIIITDNSRRAEAFMRATWYGDPQCDLTIIAVTGTNGKTTTASMIYEVLVSNGIKSGLIGTVCCRLGCDDVIASDMTTPDTERLYSYLAKMRDNGCTHLVMEASSHALAYEKLAPMGKNKIKVGIFLNLSREHLDYHKTMEAYASAKAKLFSLCEEALICADDAAAADKMAKRAQRDHFFSVSGDKGFRTDGRIIEFKAENIKADNLSGARFTLHKKDYSLSIPGGHFVQDALAAIGACSLIGIDEESAGRTIEKFGGVEGRMEKVALEGAAFDVFVDFAHTPDSLASTLMSARRASTEKLSVVFGCGGDRDRGKRALMGKVSSSLADRVIITSDNPRSEDPLIIIDEIMKGIDKEKGDCKVICDRSEAIEYAIATAVAGEVIIIAGKGHEQTQIIKGRKIPFSDRESAISAYNKRIRTN